MADEVKAKPFRQDPRREIATIRLSRLPEPLRTEVRFVLGEKIHGGEWTITQNLSAFLIHFIEMASTSLPADVSSLSDRDETWWLTRVATRCAEQHRGTRFTRDVRGRMRSVHACFTRLTETDPWRHDRWSPYQMRSSSGQGTDVVDWRPIQSDWLRLAMKAYAGDCLKAKRRAWGTAKEWAKAAVQFDEYLVVSGIDTPEAIDRQAFLAYLTWANGRWDNDTRRRRVNMMATLLGDLREEGYEPRIQAVTFLRRGECPTKRAPNPRPIPPDVLRQIEQIFNTAPELTPTMRRLLQLFRFGGPRPSEAVLVPVDALRTTGEGSFWIEYHMSKVESWRRFPIPDTLGRELAEQAAWVRSAYGQDARYMFPNERKSSAATDTFPGRCEPYSASALRRRIQRLFERHDLRPSATTAEVYKGGQLHRFRHTIATELLNQDWTQYEVQLFLGHKSHTMTQHYGRINDDRLAAKYRAAVGLIDKDGQAASIEGIDVTVERLRDRLKKAALPNGFCGLPETQKCSFRPNPCLDCSFFRTGKTFLGVHIQHRDEVQALVDDARTQGNERLVEINKPMLERLNHLIPLIEQAPDDSTVSPGDDGQ